MVSGARDRNSLKLKENEGVHWQDTQMSLADPNNRKAASAPREKA